MPVEYLTVGHLSTKDLIRFFSKVAIHPDVSWNGTSCWIWSSGRNHWGYGAFKWLGKNAATHRFTYAWLYGSLPSGKTHGEIDHLCKRPQCCNPIHLEFVTAYINGMRSNSAPSRNAKKTHCKHGHELSGHNVITTAKNHRQCRACAYRRIKEYNQRHPDVLSRAVKKWQQNNKAHIANKARERYHARKPNA